MLKNKDDKELDKIYKNMSIGKEDFRNFFLRLKPELESRLSEVMHFYKNRYSKNKIMNENIIKIIKKLKGKYTLLGFTDISKEHYKANRSRGIYKDFKKIFTSFEFGMLKAQKEAFEKLESELNAFNIKPNECIFIDDLEINVQNARELGFKAIHYPDFPETKKLFKELKTLLKASAED